MSKRKKPRASGEGIHPLKPPKNSRLGDSDRTPQSCELGCLHHPEESGGKLGPALFAEHSREEPGQAIASFPGEETGAPSSLLGQPEEEPAPLPASQNSIGRFVPQFAKPRKTVARKAERQEEDLQCGAFSPETLPKPSAQQAGSQPLEGYLGLTLQEAGQPGEPTQADGSCSEQRVQDPVKPGSGDSQPEASPEVGTGPSTSERASQNHLTEQGTNTPDGGNLGNSRPETERAWTLGDLDQKGHQPGCATEEMEPDRGAPWEGDAPRGTGADLPGGPQEEGDSIPNAPASAPVLAPTQGLGHDTWCLEPGSLVQTPPGPLQTPSGTDREAEVRHSSPGCSSLGMVVIADLSTDPLEPEQRTPEVAGPDGQASAGSLASPGGKVSDSTHRRALSGYTPLVGVTTGGSGEERWENEPHCDASVGPPASLALASGNQEPTIGTGESSCRAPDMGPGVDSKWVPDPHHKTAKSGSQTLEQDLEGLSLSLQASGLPEHRETVDGLPQETQVRQSSADTLADLAGQPGHPRSVQQATWVDPSAVELDFLLDSQMRDALDASDFEASTEQLFPAGSRLGLCWAGPSPRDNGDLATVAQGQSRAHVGTQASEASRMEDATGVVCGLVVELSNLNRLIMSTHRDLEAFKRLSYRKAKPAGKGPAPHPPKGTGTVPRGEQPWRGL
ncbi:uncharacterized protein C19orf57 homolog [Carlito syrichta]|uniref:Uncharacterized protein C19orf57 homolog n=1 Tax=Carlito syrichta TaxID=1868482 RepID=A0A3Q0DPE1_CARSF|nr:uncharacterized protein C19orf57 homolog [Carlito syrichta]